MTDTQILPNPPTAMLKVVHNQLKELFVRYHALGAEERSAKERLFQEIEELLGTHLEIEEILFYPAVQSMKMDLAINVVLRALQDHRKVKVLVEELRTLRAKHQSLDAKLAELQQCVLVHLEMEEGEIFPHARALPPEILQELSAEMEKLRDRLQEKRNSSKLPPEEDSFKD